MFDQNNADDLAASDQVARRLAQAKDQLVNQQSSSKPTEILQAETNLSDSRAACDTIRDDLARNVALQKSGAATVQIVDREKVDLRSANSKVLVPEAMLAQARERYGRDGDIKTKTAAVRAAKVALAMALCCLGQRVSGESEVKAKRRAAAQSGTALA